MFLHRWLENAASNQPLLLFGAVSKIARYDSGHCFIAITDKYLLTITDELDLGAEMRLQIADVYDFHTMIIAEVTMLDIYAQPRLDASVAVEIARIRRASVVTQRLVIAGLSDEDNCGFIWWLPSQWSLLPDWPILLPASVEEAFPLIPYDDAAWLLLIKVK